MNRSNDELTKIREDAKIYTKGATSEYQRRINVAAGEICIKNPSMLVNRGELLQQARIMLDESGYQYKKRKSRSKNFGSVSGADEPKLKRPRIDHEVRTKQKQEIEEEILTIKLISNLLSKENVWRLERRTKTSSYVISSQRKLLISTERNRRALELERRGLEKKEKKAQQYTRKKFSPSSDSESSTATVNVSSDQRSECTPFEDEVGTQIAVIQGDQDNNIDLTQHSPGGDTVILSGNDSGDSENPSPPCLSQRCLF